jgi:hypothetical protein
VAHENAEDLAADFIVGRSLKHGHLIRKTRSVSLSHNAFVVWRPTCTVEMYPPFP